VDVGKVRPNPYQPRTDFDEAKLKDLADSIRQYGMLQPLIVTRHEETRDDGISTYYELIAGERRLRASKMAGLSQVPVIIRTREEENRVRLELAIIEYLQREDLNAIDRARAFNRLQKEFGLTNTEIAEKVGKSREYVSNSIRLLSLPPEMQQAVVSGSIYEGHARALLMLSGRPDEQKTVFRDILVRKLSVREVEQITREIATEKARKREAHRPEIEALEKAFAESLGTKVEIQEKESGGKLIIDFFSTEDLEAILAHFGERRLESGGDEAPERKTNVSEANPAPQTADDSFAPDRFSI
ncbi:MAG: ParB/RepB/Spo0J family partition protein, partial [bacterium]|nr:ParB/RepB/Spo0J family partition protein [bacterium]